MKSASKLNGGARIPARAPRAISNEEAEAAAEVLDRVGDMIRSGQSQHPIPEPLFEPLHRVVPFPAIDIVLVNDENKVLMVKRDDKYFAGWELVGGYGHWQESLEEWCNRLSLRDVGVTVHLEGFIAIHKWQPRREGAEWVLEHAHGAPISLVALCRLTSGPTRKDVVIEYFDHVPEGMVPNHGRFVEVALEAMKTGRIIPAT